MLELDRADEFQDQGRAFEGGDGDRIAKWVVDPPDLRGGFDHQAGVEKAKVMAVARPEHQPVVAERHRLGIFVASTVDDLEGAHQGGIMPECPAGCTRADPYCCNQAKG